MWFVVTGTPGNRLFYFFFPLISAAHVCLYNSWFAPVVLLEAIPRGEPIMSSVCSTYQVGLPLWLLGKTASQWRRRWLPPSFGCISALGPPIVVGGAGCAVQHVIGSDCCCWGMWLTYSLTYWNLGTGATPIALADWFIHQPVVVDDAVSPQQFGIIVYFRPQFWRKWENAQDW